jgi:DNA replication protein DnaC
MESIANIIQDIIQQSPEPYDDDGDEKHIEYRNSIQGTLEGYDCMECLNRGIITVAYNTVRECRCMSIRKSLRNLERSGVAPLAERYTFEKFLTPEPWQIRLKEMVLDFSYNATSRCLLLLGMTGTGKTHLATAATVNLIMSGMLAIYAVWPEFSKRVKSLITDADLYEKELQQLRTVEVLYIDDLFKSGSRPTAADISLFFEIINARYNSRLTTLISSEYTIDQLIEIDEATAGRLFEWAGEYALNIARDPTKNFRFKQR